MENATKALVVAGAILMAIMLITIGIIMVNSTKGTTDEGIKSAKAMEIQMFNSKFEAYEGKRTGAEVNQLIRLIRTSNAVESEHQIDVFTDSNSAYISDSKTYKVYIYYSPGERDYEAGVAYDVASGSGQYLIKASLDTSEKGYIHFIEIDE